jgi:hypothetical protein
MFATAVCDETSTYDKLSPESLPYEYPVKIWDAKTGKFVASLKGYVTAHTRLGSWMSVCLWVTALGHLLQEIVVRSGDITALD